MSERPKTGVHDRRAHESSGRTNSTSRVVRFLQQQLDILSIPEYQQLVKQISRASIVKTKTSLPFPASFDHNSRRFLRHLPDALSVALEEHSNHPPDRVIALTEAIDVANQALAKDMTQEPSQPTKHLKRRIKAVVKEKLKYSPPSPATETTSSNTIVEFTIEEDNTPLKAEPKNEWSDILENIANPFIDIAELPPLHFRGNLEEMRKNGVDRTNIIAVRKAFVARRVKAELSERGELSPSTKSVLDIWGVSEAGIAWNADDIIQYGQLAVENLSEKYLEVIKSTAIRFSRSSSYSYAYSYEFTTEAFVKMIFEYNYYRAPFIAFIFSDLLRRTTDIARKEKRLDGLNPRTMKKHKDEGRDTNRLVSLDALGGNMPAPKSRNSNEPADPTFHEATYIAVGEIIDMVFSLPGVMERDRRVLREHYLHGRQIDDIAKELGVDPSRISQIHTEACGRIRSAAHSNPDLLEFIENAFEAA